MGKSLKALSGQLRKNHGVHLVPTFDSGIKPGTIILRKKWNDITKIGRLTDDRLITKEKLGPLEGPTPCMLADFNRHHEISVDAAVDLLQPVAGAKGHFKEAREAVASFNSPVTYSLSLMKIEDAVESDPNFWNGSVGQHLCRKNVFVVFQIICAKLSFLFRRSGSAGMNLKATPLGNLKAANLSSAWTWRNEAMLESKKEIVVAAEIARYRKKKRLFAVK